MSTDSMHYVLLKRAIIRSPITLLHMLYAKLSEERGAPHASVLAASCAVFDPVRRKFYNIVKVGSKLVSRISSPEMQGTKGR